MRFSLPINTKRRRDPINEEEKGKMLMLEMKGELERGPYVAVAFPLLSYDLHLGAASTSLSLPATSFLAPGKYMMK